MVQIAIEQAKINHFCQQHHIQKMSLFGSVLRDDFGQKSDIDVLVEFEKGLTPGLKFFALQNELSVIFNKPVDLNTPFSISSYFKDQVLQEKEDIYVAS